MFASLILASFILLTVSGQPCDDKNSVELTGGKTFRDNSIVKNGVRFPPKYQFVKNVEGELRTFGCICEVSGCFRKCCPLNSVMVLSVRKCVSVENASAESLIEQNGLNLYYMDTFKRRVDLRTFPDIGVLVGQPNPRYLEDDNPWYVQENGYLYIETPSSIPPWTKKPPNDYCIDTFVYEDSEGKVTSKLDALVCMTTDVEVHLFMSTSICMIISCVFILATLGVYAWLPELRNLHGKVLMAYLTCLFFGFAFLATMQILLIVDNASTPMCLTFTFIIYFSLLSAFFWLNTMSFDIWWTFSGKRGLSLERLSARGRFYAYAMYSFGIPTLLTVLMAGLEFSGLPPHPLLPLLKQNGCFIHGMSKLIYLYGPILILSIANLCFFVMTALKIAKIKKQTSVLKSKESATHDPHRKDRQRLLLNVKLFMVMGASWILEVLSALYPDARLVWRITDSYNVLIGLITFIIFVCKRKIFRLIKKRYRQVRGEALSRSQTQTTSQTSRYSKEDIRLSTVNGNNAKTG